MKYIVLFTSFLGALMLSSSILAQRGPGGVTYDADTEKNCRLWLDAGDLTDLADGDNVEVWHDKSISNVEDSAFWNPAHEQYYLSPIYRNAPSASINGKPVISFESGGMLCIGDWPDIPLSVDLNSNPNASTTYEQTMFFAFRTSNNVTDRQVIWEEGGYNRGFKIFISGNEIYIGAYDDLLDADNVPKFGFTYKKLPVEANTTYVLSFVYDVPTGAHGNVLITNTPNPALSSYAGLTGTLNGTSFPTNMTTSGCAACDAGVGGISVHPDPIGIGGLNRTSHDELGRMGESSNDIITGTQLFQGRLAEICYYAYAMNSAQRIIVENYLAAKYFANVIANDKYVYEASYGDGVIGIGRESDNIEHLVSQGDNIFEISVPNTVFSGSPKYLHIGHNNNSLAWTSQNVPDTSSIKRLGRVWRANRAGVPADKDVTLKIYPEDYIKLPALPVGYTKYGIMIEDQSTYTPNFNAANSTIYELHGDGSGPESSLVEINDGAFMTIVAIKPAVQFKVYNDYAIEGDNPPDPTTSYSAELILNYSPDTYSPPTTVDYSFINSVTAVNGTDFNGTNGTVTFWPGQQVATINFNIINNLTVETYPTRTFSIALSNPISGVTIGEISSFNFSIYDNDPDPKITFTTDVSNVLESSGIAELTVQVIGTTTAPSTVIIERPQLAFSGTASYDEDYTLPTVDGWADISDKRTLEVIIPSGTNESVTVSFPVTPTDLDEYDETIIFNLLPDDGAGVGDGSILQHTVTILDQDPEPEVSFTAANSEGYESVNDPRIYVVLDTSSSKQIIVPYVPYHINYGPPETYLFGSATNDATSPGGDYTLTPTGGTLIFEPGETEKYIPITVYGNDATGEPDETIFLELTPPTYAGLSNSLPTQHTYTIKEYSEFEWQGVAGVGKTADNTFWMVPDAGITSNNATGVPEFGPRPINIIQDVSGKYPEISSRENGINNRKMVVFNGTSDNLKVNGTGTEGQSNLINTGGFYDNKSIFFVMKPYKVNATKPQVIYEQGGGWKGMSVYIILDKLYFSAWNYTNDGDYSPWGIDNNHYTVSYVESSVPLVANQAYVVSCHFSRNWSYGEGVGGLKLYINGELVDTYTGTVGRLYTHTGYTSIGSAWHQTKFHNSNSTSYPANGTTVMDNWYEGEIGEFIYYNEPKMNEARIRILHNYLSSQYKISLGSAQDFDLTYADNLTSTEPDFNNQMAGIGHIGSVVHGDSQGNSELRVSNPAFANSTDFLTWGNNGESLTNTWPYFNTILPATINERSGKVWRFNNPGNGVSKVDLSIRYSASNNSSEFQANPTLLKLLYHSNSDPQDFSNANVVSGTNLSGGIAHFENVTVTDGMYFTLGNTSNYFNTPLPIELTSFDAQLSGDKVNLTWITSTEVNNEYFEIERANDDFKWESLLTTPGAGNSTTENYYAKVDYSPLSGVSYYRLKQVDFDGNYTYSDAVSVNYTQVSTDEFYIFPNPVENQELSLYIPMLNDEYAIITVYDLTGKVCIQKRIIEGQRIEKLELTELTKGLYLIELKSLNYSSTKKLIVG